MKVIARDTRLYIVPTPIGNLGDITERAIQAMRNVQIILAEDTRKTGQLLKQLDIQKPIRSHHAHNEHKKVEQIIDQMLEGSTFALVSDAGTPAISDPGYLLVHNCIRQGIGVECLPGPTAFVPALVKSGFPIDSFVFEGFLPHKKGRKKKLLRLSDEDRTIVLYESPHRILKLLKEFSEILGERSVSVSRELTKIHEETVIGTSQEIYNYYEGDKIRGEFVVVIEAKKTKNG